MSPCTCGATDCRSCGAGRFPACLVGGCVNVAVDECRQCDRPICEKHTSHHDDGAVCDLCNDAGLDAESARRFREAHTA